MITKCYEVFKHKPHWNFFLLFMGPHIRMTNVIFLFLKTDDHVHVILSNQLC